MPKSCAAPAVTHKRNFRQSSTSRNPASANSSTAAYVSGGFTSGSFPIAYGNYRRMLSLPLNPGLSDQDVDDVIAAVLDVVRCHQA